MKRFHSIKKNSDYQEGLQKRNIICQQVSCHVCIGDGRRRYPNRDFRQQTGRKQRSPASVYKAGPGKFSFESGQIESGRDIVVVARAAAKDKSFDRIERAFLHLCGLHNILKESK